MSSIINSLTAKVSLIFMLLVSSLAVAQEMRHPALPGYIQQVAEAQPQVELVQQQEEIATEQRLDTKVELTKEEWVKYHADQMQLEKDFVLNLQKLDAKLFCLAQNNFFEAKGESFLGKVAIAEVVKNRAESDRYPNDICSVVKQSTDVKTDDDAHKRVCQFSWFCMGLGRIPLRDKKGNINPNVYQEWYDSVVAAMIVYQGKFRGLVGNATHFYNPKLAKPDWAKRFKKVEVIGNHTFMEPKAQK